MRPMAFQHGLQSFARMVPADRQGAPQQTAKAFHRVLDVGVGSSNPAARHTVTSSSESLGICSILRLPRNIRPLAHWRFPSC
jgi:hypothetical protein